MPPPRGARGIDDLVDRDDIRGWAEGMREEVDGWGRGDSEGDWDGVEGNGVAETPGGLAIGCSGRTGWPGSMGRSGGTTT